MRRISWRFAERYSIHSLYPDYHVQIIWWRLSESVLLYHLVLTFNLVGTCNQGWLNSFLGKPYTSNTILYGTDMVFLIFICFRNCCIGWLWYRWRWSEFRTCFLSRWSCFNFAHHIEQSQGNLCMVWAFEIFLI
jgi:hypothetical protein